MSQPENVPEDAECVVCGRPDVVTTDGLSVWHGRLSMDETLCSECDMSDDGPRLVELLANQQDYDLIQQLVEDGHVTPDEATYTLRRIDDAPDAGEIGVSVRALADDDTEPDEYGNEPRECVICNLDPPEGGAVVTTNRSLFSVNMKLWIDPVCEPHETFDTATKVEETYDYGGVEFVADGIAQGVFSREDALEHLPDDEHDALEGHL